MANFRTLASGFKNPITSFQFPVSSFEFRVSKPIRGIAAACLIACVFLPWSSVAQQPGNVILDSNEQVFCVLASLNAAGYDTGVGVDPGSGTREAVRRVLSKKNLPILPELVKFYADHRVAGDPGADLGQYISLALLIGAPPEFRLTVPRADLPPDAKAVAGVIPLLKTIYDQADLLALWAQLQPRVQDEIQRYSEPVRKSIVRSEAYLRFPSGAYLGRTYTIALDLLGAPEQVHARIYGMNYYLVVTPSRQPKISEVRHQYLHFLLDPLAVKYAAEIQTKAELKGLARQAPDLAADFKEDFPLLLTECLIRSAELRIDKRPKAEAQNTVDELTASGLILTPYFYSALEDYEQQDASMNVVYKRMVLGIDVRDVEKSLASVKFTPRPAAASNQAPPALTEEERLLNQGDNFFYQRRYDEAKAVFQSVLEKLNPKSERALFGLAIVASNTRKPDLAEEYFLKTLEAARDLWIATWAHIYLGRIYDLKGKREEALGQYRAASLTAAMFPEALRAVENGLKHPFGSKD